MPGDKEQRHHRGPVSRAGTAYIRTRTTSACQRCRARRAKCDNERPCTNCRRVGAQCSSDPQAVTAGFDPASLAILAKIEVLQNDIRSLSTRLHQSCNDSRDVPSTVPAGSLRLGRHLQRGHLSQVLAWNVWHPHEMPRDSSSRDLGCTGAQAPSESIVSMPGSDRGLDFTLFAGYVDEFFRNVHVLNPVLDERQIRNQLKDFLLGGVGWDASSCLLLLVLANGACSSTYGTSTAPHNHTEVDKHRLAPAQALFDAAEKRKDTLWRADYLTQARCHFYSGVFMMVLMQPFCAWRWFLHGLATCQRLITNSSQRGSGDAIAPDSQAEESIYWSCWKSERELRFELDMPDFPSAVYGHPVMFPSLPQVSDRNELRAWYFYLAEISLWRFEMTARQTMSEFVNENPSALESLAQRIEDLDMTLTSWQDSLPDAFRLDATAELETKDLLLFVLRGRLTYNYEVLTWPFLETQVLFGEHSSTRTAELAGRAVRMHYDRLSINRPGFFHLHHGTWLMQRSSARSACVLLAVARSSSAGLLPMDWLEMVSDTVAMLEYWNEEPDNEVIAFLRSVLHDFVK